jgi:hypothetical protein
LSSTLESHLLDQVDRAHGFFWHRARWRVVSSYLPKEAPFELVDVGAGSGVLAAFLERERPLARYRFVEPIDSLRCFLREHYGAEADAGDDADYLSAGFVTLLDVLEHQQDDRAFLTELVDRMRPGATLLVTVPAGQHLWSRWDVSLGHLRRYDRSSLAACTRGLPLRTHEVSYLFPEMVPAAAWRARRGDRRRHHPSASGLDEASFPDLPRAANEALAALSKATAALRRHWAWGTSLFLAATVDRPAS